MTFLRFGGAFMTGSMAVSDFETTYDNDVARVWLADLCDMDTLEHITVCSIQAWLQAVLDFGYERLYFHNLKHDGAYILDYLLKHGHTWVDNKKELADNTVTGLISDVGAWYYIIMQMCGRKIEIYDSLKKIPLSVANMAKAYGLDVQKGEIDYKLIRGPDYAPTTHEIGYVQRDTEIVAKCLRMKFENGLRKMTVASDALAEYRKTVPFETYFVTKYWTTHPTIDAFCRRAYFGGISWVNPLIEGVEVNNIHVYDYNSMYPSVMLRHPFPVYYPARFQTTPHDGYPLYIARCKVDVELLPGCLPTLRDSRTGNWLTEFNGELTLTSVDIETAADNYSGSVDVIEGYCFRQETGIFDHYIDAWKKVKENSTGGQRQIAKDMQNSLYGKFGTNPLRARRSVSIVDGKLKTTVLPYEEGRCLNVAIAAFVTAYARRELSEGFHNSSFVCYVDTDSLHIGEYAGVKPTFGGKIDARAYGHWKKEGEFVRGKYLRQKTYIEEREDGSLNVCACGCPEGAKQYITFDNFKMGAKYPGKLSQKIVPGGCILSESTFTVHAPMRFKF